TGLYAPIKECDTSHAYQGLDNILHKYGSGELYNNMTTYWPSENKSNNWFWTHEWRHHGICVSTLVPECYSSHNMYQGVLDYFKQALDLRAEYDLYAALDSAGIQPGSNPNKNEIHSAIRAAFGEDAMLKCDPHSGDMYEIRLYFHVKGKSQYVLTAPLETGSCQGSVGYPEKY
ncbi:ribonuclease T2-like protein, partial [Jimgerdemannia flammicorona]